MYFALTPEQLALQDEVRSVLNGADTPAIFRKLLDSSVAMGISRAVQDQVGEPCALDMLAARSTWELLCKGGWVGVGIPREYGGGGLGAVELGVVAQECGRGLAPVPLVTSSAVALAVNRWGSEEQRRCYLPALASGDLVGLLGFWGSEGVLRVSVDEKSLRQDCFFSGAVRVVGGPLFDRALVLVVGESGVAHGPNPALLLEVDPDSEGWMHFPSIDGDWSRSVLTLEGVEAVYLGDEAADGEASDRTVDIGAVLVACEQLGAAERCLELAVEYARRRYAFGQPIGSFQALRHKLADLYVSVEFARSNVYFALWALDQGWDQLPVAACQARIAAGQALCTAAEENVHVHGAYGYTWDADPQLFLRRSRALDSTLGGGQRWRELLMRRLLDGCTQGNERTGGA